MVVTRNTGTASRSMDAVPIQVGTYRYGISSRYTSIPGTCQWRRTTQTLVPLPAERCVRRVPPTELTSPKLADPSRGGGTGGGVGWAAPSGHAFTRPLPKGATLHLYRA